MTLAIPHEPLTAPAVPVTATTTSRDPDGGGTFADVLAGENSQGPGGQPASSKQTAAGESTSAGSARQPARKTMVTPGTPGSRALGDGAALPLPALPASDQTGSAEPGLAAAKTPSPSQGVKPPAGTSASAWQLASPEVAAGLGITAGRAAREVARTPSPRDVPASVFARAGQAEEGPARNESAQNDLAQTGPGLTNPVITGPVLIHSARTDPAPSDLTAGHPFPGLAAAAGPVALPSVDPAVRIAVDGVAGAGTAVAGLAPTSPLSSIVGGPPEPGTGVAGVNRSTGQRLAGRSVAAPSGIPDEPGPTVATALGAEIGSAGPTRLGAPPALRVRVTASGSGSGLVSNSGVTSAAPDGTPPFAVQDATVALAEVGTAAAHGTAGAVTQTSDTMGSGSPGLADRVPTAAEPGTATHLSGLAPGIAGTGPALVATETASPAEQVVAAVTALTTSPARHDSSAAPRVLTVQLNPDELGRVHIRIDRTVDGGSRIDLTAERADTLQLLRGDQSALHRALDAAGIGPDARIVRFHLADAATGQMPPSPPPGAQSFAGGSFGQAPQRDPGGPAIAATAPDRRPFSTMSEPVPAARRARMHDLRVDITA